MNNLILHADDDTIFSRIVKQILQQKGFEVHSAYDGEHAWLLFNQEKFSSCLLDIMMPGMSGIELGEKIRNVNKEVPIIYLSGEDQALVEQEVFGKGGGNSYFSKTFNIRELTALLSNALKPIVSTQYQQ